MNSILNATVPQPVGCGPSRSTSGGFTLIEIMIVVLIIGVLMAIAYPSYQNHVIKTRRAVAAGCALEAAQFMERYYTTNLTYEASAGNAPALPACSSDLGGQYAVSVSAVAPRSYTIQAQPEGRQASVDKKCGTLTIDQKGERKVSNTGTSPSQCW